MSKVVSFEKERAKQVEAFENAMDMLEEALIELAGAHSIVVVEDIEECIHEALSIGDDYLNEGRFDEG